MSLHLPLAVSFEFFPPNTPVGSEKLKTVVRELAAAEPEFFSVTYGAGGATRDKTLATVAAIAALGHEAAPHLSCVGSTREGIEAILATYQAQRIQRLVALRGDLPSGTATAGEFRYAAELIAFIRERYGSDWHIEVAAYPEYHPQQRYAKRDLEHFAAKVRAGADSRTSTSSTRCARSASRCRSSPASCRSTTTPASPSSPPATASRSRAGWR